MRAGLIVGFFLVASNASTAVAFDFGKEVGHCFHGGCDVAWTVNQKIDAGIRSKSESLVGPAKAAFDDSMRILFDQKLNPFVNHIDQVLSARIEQIGDRADRILAEATSGILKIISAATGDAKQIVVESFDAADKLVDKINSDISQLVADVDCKVNGTFQGLLDELKRTLPTPPHPFDHCYRDIGYTFTVPDDTDFVNWYRITKCKYLEDLNNSQTVEDVKDNYGRLSLLARRLRCIAQDPLVTARINEESAIYSAGYEIWKLASQ